MDLRADLTHAAPQQGRWGLDPRRPFRMRRFEDAAILMDEMTGHTHRLSLDAAWVLEALRVGPLPVSSLASQLAALGSNPALLQSACLDILRDLSALGLVIPPNASDPEASAFPN